MISRAITGLVIFTAYAAFAQEVVIDSISTQNGTIKDVVTSTKVVPSVVEMTLLCSVSIHAKKNGNTEAFLRLFNIESGDWGTWSNEDLISQDSCLNDELLNMQKSWVLSTHDGSDVCQSSTVFDFLLNSNQGHLPTRAKWKTNTKPNAHVTFTCSYECRTEV